MKKKVVVVVKKPQQPSLLKPTTPEYDPHQARDRMITAVQAARSRFNHEVEFALRDQGESQILTRLHTVCSIIEDATALMASWNPQSANPTPDGRHVAGLSQGRDAARRSKRS